MTETVRNWRDYAPGGFPLAASVVAQYRVAEENPWFEAEVLPALREEVRRALDD